MQRIWWSAVDGAVLRYDLQTQSDDRRWWLIAQIDAVTPNDNWDASREQFFYDHTAGDPENLYRVTAVSTLGTVLGESPVFQANALSVHSEESKIRVDHDYPTVDALRYVSPGSSPISQAEVMIFTEPDWNQNRRTVPVARTQTSNDGRWAAPIYLTTGMNYVVYFVKDSAYGPDTTTITV